MIFVPAIAPVLSVGSTHGAYAPILLRYKFKQGETLNYTMSMNMAMTVATGGAGQPMNMTTSSQMKMKVMKVEPDGTASIQETVPASSTSMNGKAMSVPNPLSGKVITLTMSPTGDVKNFNMPKVAGASMFGMGSGNMQIGGALPKGPVQPGSHWVTSGKSFGFDGIEINNTLEKISQSGGSTLVYIHGMGTVDIAKMMSKLGKGKALGGMNMGGTMTMDLHIVMNASAGRQESVTGNMNYSMNMNNPAASGSGPKSMHMSGKAKLSMQLSK